MAIALLPDVLEVLAGDQDQVQRTDFLYIVAHDTAYALPVLDKIQFVFTVLMQRVVENILMPLHDVEAVPLGEAGDFRKNG